MKKNSIRISLLSILIIITFNSCSGRDYYPSEPLSHKYYGEVDLVGNPPLWKQTFIQEYAEAIVENEIWVTDPFTLALRYAGYPNLDMQYPDKVFAYHTFGADKYVVVVLEENCMDDSIRDQEERIDLTEVDGIWKIEWAGIRQRCRRSGYDGWVMEPCP